MAHPTSSFRAPVEHHAIVRSVAAAVTHNPALANAIAKLLTIADAGATGDLFGRVDNSDLAQRVLALEKAVAEMVRPSRPDLPARHAQYADAMRNDPHGWFQGHGSSRRLSPAGRIECDGRLLAGEPAVDIAQSMGLAAASVRYRLDRLVHINGRCEP